MCSQLERDVYRYSKSVGPTARSSFHIIMTAATQ